MAIKSYKKGAHKQLSENFKLSEFHCHCNRAGCKTTKLDEELIKRLQYIRDVAGVSITVNSGFRCTAHNKSVGGSSTSKHPMGRAADIVIKGMKPIDMAKLAVKAGFRGVILYSNRIHVDTRETGTFYHRNYNGGRYSKPVKTSWGVSAEINPYTEPTATVKYGDKGLNVRWVQWALKVSGIKLDKIDGSFGTKTKSAVALFQIKHGLENDGKVGPKTRAALKEAIK